MKDQFIYILPVKAESEEAMVITVKDGTIYYKTVESQELGEIEVFAQGYETGNMENELPTWSASSLVADLHNSYIEKGFNH